MLRITTYLAINTSTLVWAKMGIPSYPASQVETLMICVSKDDYHNTFLVPPADVFHYALKDLGLA